MISKEEFLWSIVERMDPDEIVDAFGITSEEMVSAMDGILYLRRYRVRDLFEGRALAPIDESEYEERT